MKETINEKIIKRVLNWLSNWNYGYNEKRLKEDILKESKRYRDKHGKEKAFKEGYNIYKKRELKIDTIIQYCLENNFIEVIKFENEERELEITPYGLKSLKEMLTQNYSKEYYEFKNGVNNILKEHNQPKLKEIQIMKLFDKGYSIEKASEFYIKYSTYLNETKAYQEHIFSKCINIPLDNKYIFNLAPKLFVPTSVMDRKVYLKIEGIETPKNMIIEKPYPNKRYYVAGLNLDGEKSIMGFYPIIKNKENFPEDISIKLIWTIKDYMTIIHHLNIKFKFVDDIGFLFSTVQHVSRGMNINEFSLTTFVENDKELYRKRDVKYEFDKKNKIINIYENATLNNYPIEFQSYCANKYKNIWLENNYRK